MGVVSASATGNNIERSWLGFPDLDALFRPRARDDNWTWKPPSCDTKAIRKKHERNDEHHATSRVELSARLSECDSVEAIRTALGSTRLSPKHFMWLSTNAFNQLLSSHSQQLNADRELDIEDVGELLYFLQSELEDTSSQNFENFMKALRGKSMTENALSHLIAIIQDKVQLGTLRVSAVPCILSILPGVKCNSTTRDAQLVGLIDSVHTYMSRFDLETIVKFERMHLFMMERFPIVATRLLSATSPDYLSVSLMIRLSGTSHATVGTAQICADYLAVWAQSFEGPDSLDLKTSTIASWLSEKEDIVEVQKSALLQSTLEIVSRCKEDPSLLQGLSRWLCILRGSFARRPTPSQSFWDALYPALAENLRPYQLADYFGSFNDNTDVMRVLFTHWYVPEALKNMPLMEPLRNEDEAPTLANAVQATLETRFGTGIAWRSIEPNTKANAHPIKVTDTLRDASNFELGNELPIYQPFVAALDTLIEHTGMVDYKFVEEIFSLFDAFGNANHITPIFNRLVDRGDRVDISQLSEQTSSLLINHFVGISKLSVATRIFLNCPAATLEHNQPLFLAHLDTQSPDTGFLFAMLNRAYSGNNVPHQKRQVRTNRLSGQFIDLVNTMLFALARAPGLTPRQAYRAVWQCYRYQRDRGVEPRSDWSRALVHAGVTRFLREGLWLSSMRLEFILKWVRQIEGDIVADKLAALAERWMAKLRTEQQRASYESDGRIQLRGSYLQGDDATYLEDEASAAEKNDEATRKRIGKRILRLWRKNRPWLKRPVEEIKLTDAEE
ncbi:hypothetical protein MBLNU457_g2789t1 [Dothideomycetes sp. NU457]